MQMDGISSQRFDVMLKHGELEFIVKFGTFLPLPIAERQMSRSSVALICICIGVRTALDCTAYFSIDDSRQLHPVF